MTYFSTNSFNSRIKSALVLVPVFYLIFVKNGYGLGWDDADYLRMTTCFPVGLSHLDFSYLLTCEQDLYKSPILMHLGIFLTPFLILRNEIDVVLTVSLLVSLLSLVTFYAYFKLQSFFHSFVSKLILGLGFWIVFHDFRSIYMTDMINALVIGIATVKFLQIYDSQSKNDVTKIAMHLGLLSVLLSGIRTTSVPIYFLLIIATFITYAKFRSFKIFLFLWGPSVLFAILLLTIWKAVLVSAVSMFSGDISQYTGKWIDYQSIDSLKYTFEVIGFGLVFVFTLFLRRLLTKQLFSSMRVSLIAFAPAFSVFLLYISSQSKDPRFLLWPLFQIICIEVFLFDRERQVAGKVSLQNSPNPLNVHVLRILLLSLLSILLGMYSWFLVPKKTEFNLTSALQIYEMIPIQGGTVCPLTDSANLNISKMLLIDQVNGGKKNLRNRIINVPDSVMNGKSLEEIRKIIGLCSITYNELSVDPSTIKNEFLFEKLSTAKSYRQVLTTDKKILFSYNDFLN
jgi:hypothetical protein